MSEISSYLKRLKWDPNLASNWAAGLLTNIRITILIILTIILGGIFGLVNLPRRINPEVKIPIVFVSTVLPGASPQDVEELVTEPVENAVRSVQGIESISSTSLENISTIVIEFNSRIDREKAKNDVQSSVDTVNNLPTNAQEPSVMALDFEDIAVVEFSVTGSTNEAALMQFSRNLQKEIEDLAEVQKVIVSGLEQTEIEIQLQKETLNALKLNPQALMQAIRVALSSYPSGTVSSNGLNLSIAIVPSNDALATLRELPIEVGQTSYALGELTTISIKSSSRQPKSFYATPQQSPSRTVTFSVFKTLDAALEKSAAVVKKRAQEVTDQSGGLYSMVVTSDFEENIQDQFNGLLSDFGQSILLVFLTLLIFLGIRQAAIASFVIPLSFFATFATMYMLDIQLSFLSLFSLLLGLGMIVDDTIVMISAMTDYYASKKFTPQQTGLLVWKDYLTPTLTSNLTNVWSFLPLLIATGIIGEFTKVISLVVTIALIGSTAIALIITIPLMIVILKPRVPQRAIMLSLATAFLMLLIAISVLFKSSPLLPLIYLALTGFLMIFWIVRNTLITEGKTFMSKIMIRGIKAGNIKEKLRVGFFDAKKPIRYYKAILSKILVSKSIKRRVIAAVVIFSLVSYALVPAGLVKNEFFPKVDEDFFFATVELPIGTKLAATQEEASRLLEELRQTPEIEYVLMDIGVDVNMRSTTSEQNTNSIRYTFKLTEKRTHTSFDIAQQVRESYTSYEKGTFQVIEASAGPPSGADLQLTILGEDLEKLQQYGENLRTYVKNLPGTTNAELSIIPGVSRLNFIPDKQKLIEQGIVLDQIGFFTRLFTSGMEVDSVAIDTPECVDECPIMLRVTKDQLTAEELGSITMLNRKGETVPLVSLGSFSLAPNPTKVTRLDGKRSIAVSAAVLPGFNRVELGKMLEQFATSELGLEQGYSWQTGGVNEENQKSVNSILQAMVIAAVLIMGTMVVELGSFRKSLIVMLVIPLAISGVFYVFALTGIPLSFPSLIGILALFGIVVKNSILIVDKINKNLEIGLPFTESVADGASSRLEPIVFSSVTNIIGLIPITISDPLWRGLGGAIIAGLTLSGLIMLLFIPVIYDVWYRPKESSN